MKKLLQRYVKPESITEILKDFPDFSSPNVVFAFVNDSKLSGRYKKEFNYPDVGIVETVEFPDMPEVIDDKLHKRVLKTMADNRAWTKDTCTSYLLTGFVRCGHCDKALTGVDADGRHYYRHGRKRGGGQHCVFASIPGPKLVDPVLDFLFKFFTDEAAFDAAVAEAMPTDEERIDLEQERDKAKAAWEQAKKDHETWEAAIVAGLKVTPLIIAKQAKLENAVTNAATRLAKAQAKLDSLPDREVVKLQSMQIRMGLLDKVRNRDWRKLSREQIRAFLKFLFGPPGRKCQGIVVSRVDNCWTISYRGKVDTRIPEGGSLSAAAETVIRTHNELMKKVFSKPVVLTRQT